MLFVRLTVLRQGSPPLQTLTSKSLINVGTWNLVFNLALTSDCNIHVTISRQFSDLLVDSNSYDRSAEALDHNAKILTC